MALLQWSSKYSVGVDSMDRQHTKLFEILNELHTAMLKGQAQKITGDLLSKLVSYTREHFAAEEALMAAARYSALEQHRVKHRALLKQVDDLSERYKRGENNLNLHLLNFLRDWLTNHIQQEDKQYEPALSRRAAS